jgi:hypothetical protein
MLMLIELGLVIVALILASSCPTLGSDWFEGIENSLAKLARKQRLSVIVVGLAALAARAVVLPILPVPQPHVNDEFSHLLLADTILHGRLSNPTPPMWIHFETVHVIMQPTYASMYPPAQGLVLAAGRLIGGHPFVGVWLSAALMCASICWMLQGWLKPEWALLGGLLVVMRLGVFSYWANSYWGGAVAAIGGALVLGSLPRIMQFQRPRDAILMGLGIAILADSRPYEAFILCVPVAFVLFIWLVKMNGPTFAVRMQHVVLPITIVVAIAAVGTGYYCQRVSGNPFRMPYQVALEAYGIPPLLLWQSQSPKSVTYNHERLQDYYLGMSAYYKEVRSIPGMVAHWSLVAVSLWFFFLGPVLTLPLLIALMNLPVGFSLLKMSQQARFLVLAFAFCLVGFAELFFLPHYAAPITCLIFALVLLAMRRLRAWQWRGKTVGLFLARSIPMICLLMLGLRAAAGPLHLPLTTQWPRTWYNSTSEMTDRAHIESQLAAIPGNHLVFVRYQPHTRVQDEWEWMYNAADIENAKTVWAWDMGPGENQELIDYFKSRRPWLVEPDEPKPSLEPYSQEIKVQGR